MTTDDPISEHASDLQAQISREMRNADLPPTAEALAALRRFLGEQAQELTRQVKDIEEFLGFVETSEGLAVRIARIEKFLGLKG